MSLTTLENSKLVSFTSSKQLDIKSIDIDTDFWHTT